MWVAQEWRRTWGLTFSARPTRPAYFLTTPKTPTRDSRPATGVEEDRFGVAAAQPLLRLEQGAPLTREPVGQGGPGEAADRDDALLVPLAEHPEQGQVGPLHRSHDVTEVQPHDLAHAGARAVEDFEEGPVAQDRRTGADDGPEQPLGLLLAQRLGQHVRDGDGGQIERGVVAPQPFFDQEAVEAPDARERPGHRRGAMGPAQRLQVRRDVRRRRGVDAVAR